MLSILDSYKKLLFSIHLTFDDFFRTLKVFFFEGVHFIKSSSITSVEKAIEKSVEKMMVAQKKYLGSIDSTSRYDIFLYLSDDKEDSPTGLGALEHHNSTVVVLSDSFSEEMLAKSMIDIVAHEFFHILTPL